MVCCLDLYRDAILWSKAVEPGVDRLAIDPEGRFLYVPTGEDRTAGFINVLDADSGERVREVVFSNRSPRNTRCRGRSSRKPRRATAAARTSTGSIRKATRHHASVPMRESSAPMPSTAKAALSSTTSRACGGMQVADLETGRIVTAALPQHPPGNARLMHGIGWTPGESEVWQSSSGRDSHVYIWSMAEPMAPAFKKVLSLTSGRGSHWLTFSIAGDFAYVAPEKTATTAPKSSTPALTPTSERSPRRKTCSKSISPTARSAPSAISTASAAAEPGQSSKHGFYRAAGAKRQPADSPVADCNHAVIARSIPRRHPPDADAHPSATTIAPAFWIKSVVQQGRAL
jgi:hypothetical protein